MLSGSGTDKRPGPTDNLSADQSVTSVESRVGDVVTRLGVVPKMIYWIAPTTMIRWIYCCKTTSMTTVSDDS